YLFKGDVQDSYQIFAHDPIAVAFSIVEAAAQEIGRGFQIDEQIEQELRHTFVALTRSEITNRSFIPGIHNTHVQDLERLDRMTTVYRNLLIHADFKSIQLREKFSELAF